MVRLTLSLVIADWLGMGIAISFRLCTYAMRSTCGRRGAHLVLAACHVATVNNSSFDLQCTTQGGEQAPALQVQGKPTRAAMPTCERNNSRQATL